MAHGTETLTLEGLIGRVKALRADFRGMEQAAEDAGDESAAEFLMMQGISLDFIAMNLENRFASSLTSGARPNV